MRIGERKSKGRKPKLQMMQTQLLRAARASLGMSETVATFLSWLTFPSSCTSQAQSPCLVNLLPVLRGAGEEQVLDGEGPCTTKRRARANGVRSRQCYVVVVAALVFGT